MKLPPVLATFVEIATTIRSQNMFRPHLWCIAFRLCLIQLLNILRRRICLSAYNRHYPFQLLQTRTPVKWDCTFRNSGNSTSHRTPTIYCLTCKPPIHQTAFTAL
uniref:Uncharacterized protein n=1 Tax=Rhipicephalus microplus TaxID=6941 RepID=A0A6G5A0I6_RHIMP